MRIDRQVLPVRRLVSLGLIGAILALLPSAALAATDPPAPSSRASLVSPAVVARAVASASPTEARRTDAKAQAQAPATSSNPFFKTRAGMVALTVLAVGTGYAVYSAKHDRIRGSGR